MRKRWRSIALLVILGLAATTAVLLTGRAALHQVPDFYEDAVAIPVEKQVDAGYQFEQNVLELHNDLRRHGDWIRIFSQEQINGWLAVDLPKKFPDLLPPNLKAPRVALSWGQMRLACRYSSSSLTTVLNFTVEIGLADEPNTLAIRIRKARAGLIPLPLRKFLDEITSAARRANLTLRWAQTDGDPVAMITVGDQTATDKGRVVTLESIDLEEGRIYFAGSTEGSEHSNE